MLGELYRRDGQWRLLAKRIANEAPQLVSLVKSASVSLAKAGLATHRAQVCLVLDISASMSKL